MRKCSSASRLIESNSKSPDNSRVETVCWFKVHLARAKPTPSRICLGTWFEFKEKVRVGRRALELDDATHLRAVRALLRMRQLRSELVERWERQMACQGGLAG